MAITLGAPVRYSVGGRFRTLTPFTLDNSYPAGGYPVTGLQLGLQAGIIDTVDANTQPDSGYAISYNAVTGNVQAFNTLSAHTHTENTAGAYTQNATTAAATPGPGAEVVAATNLAAVTGTLVCDGR